MFKIHKKGEKIISIWWFFCLAFVATAISLSVLIFYSYSLDVNSLETESLNDKIINCLSDNGFLSVDFDNFDLIYCMDSSNLTNVLSLARNEADRQKVLLILNELEPNSNAAVPDPYYGSMNDFEAVYHLLDKATDCIIEKIKNGKIR
jgi:protein-tyrosine phosphatase